MLEIIKTNDGYMVQSTEGDYVCDANGDNLFDTYEEAEAVFYGTPVQTAWAKPMRHSMHGRSTTTPRECPTIPMKTA